MQSHQAFDVFAIAVGLLLDEVGQFDGVLGTGSHLSRAVVCRLHGGGDVAQIIEPVLERELDLLLQGGLS